MGVLDKLTTATRARRTHTVCLDGQLQAEHDKLTASLGDVIAADAQQGSLADPTPNLTAHVEQMEAIRERMLESQVTFTIEPPAWTMRVQLQAFHPPREGNPIDQRLGYNTDTFLPAILQASTAAIEDTEGDVLDAGEISVDPKTGDVQTGIPQAAWDRFFATVNFGTINRLTGLAIDVNDEDVQVPSSARSLLESQDSGASLAQPSPGRSRPSGSAAGSRRGSKSSSTAKKAARTKDGSSE